MLTQALSPEALVDADLDTLVPALYVKIDDMLVKDRRPGHPVKPSQPELVCLAVAQALPPLWVESWSLGGPARLSRAEWMICAERASITYGTSRHSYSALRAAPGQEPSHSL